MAESRDIDEILSEARSRWLRPNEVCEILINYQRFYITEEPPNKPPSGSLLLYDRKALRHFRKDGYNWRKKKDGITVQEAHEKLKVGGVDVLHCYYAHGEDNENLQRRCYSMLDAKLEHIVLVHYRDVEGEHRKNERVGHVDSFTSNSCTPSGEEDNMFQLPQDHSFHLVHPHSQNNSVSYMPVNANDQSLGFGKIILDGNSYNEASVELKKLDSFGRWMDEEIGGDCNDSLMASDSGNYWNTIDTQSNDKEVSSLSHHMQLEIDSIGPSLSQDQLFSIQDFSPDWAYSGVETKVLISGIFLGDSRHRSRIKWCCMFGEVEVPADVLTNNVLRCQAPVHAPRRVPFYITCSNRLACSEVREFEYRENPSGDVSYNTVKIDPRDEVHLQIRLAKMLHLGLDSTRLNCFFEGCDNYSLKNDIFSRRSEDEKEWGDIEKACNAIERYRGNPTDALIQKLLKESLSEWLVCKIQEGGNELHILDDEGQGVIHLAAALGYKWAMGPIVAAGVSPNFRDAYGRTGLHWAAYFGREEIVVELVRLGSNPGGVDDRTSKSPGGQTAADLASSRGYTWIAGFLDQHMRLLT